MTMHLEYRLAGHLQNNQFGSLQSQFTIAISMMMIKLPIFHIGNSVTNFSNFQKEVQHIFPNEERGVFGGQRQFGFFFRKFIQIYEYDCLYVLN